MAEEKLTVFQRLQRVLSNGETQKNFHTNNYNIVSTNSDVIATANSKDEYERKVLQAQQQALLGKQWIKANYDIASQTLAGLNDLKRCYTEYDLMDQFPEIGAALDIFSEEACLHGDTKIKLLNGEVKTIKELYNENYKDFWVYSVDENGNSKPSCIEKVIYKGKKPIYKVILDDGTEILCTDNHKWLLSNNVWIETRDLKSGDSLLSIYSIKDNKGYENHGIVSIVPLNITDDVFDLLNSTTNHCFGVQCNNGLVISHNCWINDTGVMVNVSSRSDRVKSILEDLFVNRLSIHTILPMICRSMCKYGNTFMLLNIDSKNGILGWKQLPVYEMERWESGQNTPYATPIMNLNTVDENAPQDTKFVWVGQNEYIPYRNWQIAHFRLLYDSIFLPYGCAVLFKARRHFRMLSQMEDMMLIYRLDRSIERRVFKINVGAIDENDVQAYVQEIANNFKRKPIVDPLTGQIDLRKSFMNVTEDFFIPTRDDNAANPIETLQGAQNLTAMDDIKFVQNKVLTALRVPRSFLNFEETAGDGKNLSLLDVRFTRTVNRIQQALLMELNKIAIIHLYINGFQDELNNFTLTMNNPSSQAEMLELENLAKKITTAKDAVSDPGGGMPLTSLMWAWKHIFKWSDKEIKQNLEELRLETALTAELQKTMQIIKKTGLFDKVDNIYGEPGAEYSEQPQGEGDDMGGGPGGGGGMPPIGGGDMDFGDEGDMGEDMGAEGEMGMDTAAQENGIGGPDNGGGPDMGEPEPNSGGPAPNLAESFMRRMDKKLINEKKRVKNNLLERSKHYSDILEQRLLNTDKENKAKKVDIYDKAFFLNEEMNNIKNQLEKINDDFSENEE